MKSVKIKNVVLAAIIYTISLTNTSFAQIVDLEVGLQAHYTFSGDARDVTGNGNDGTVFGSPTLTTDRFGNPNSAYEFDGVNDLINTYSTFDYPNRTLSLWVNPYDVQGSGVTAHVAVSQDDDALEHGLLRVDFANNGMKLWAGGANGTYTADTVAKNAWMHLVLIRQDSISKYYVDNVLVHTSTVDGVGSTNRPNAEFIIGAGRSTIYQFFEGKIDDIRVYNRAINECEIETIFSGNTEGLASGLQAHYTFSSDARDVTGNGNDGTIFGSPTLTTDRFGNPNSAYEFDGVDDLINTYSTFDYPSRTLSLWVNPYDLCGSGVTAHVAVSQDDDALEHGLLRVDFANHEMKLWAGGSTGTYITSDVAENAWMHLVLIREDSVSKYYVDNVLVHTSTADGAGSTNRPNAEFIIGAGRSTIYQFFEGKIDDIRVYNRAINECEVEDLFKEIYTADTVSTPDTTSADNSIEKTTDTTGITDTTTVDSLPEKITETTDVADTTDIVLGTIESASEFVVNLYPNPTTGTFTIEHDIKAIPAKIQIINGLGEVMQRHDVRGLKTDINLENYTSGVYYIQLFYEESIVSRRVSKH